MPPGSALIAFSMSTSELTCPLPTYPAMPFVTVAATSNIAFRISVECSTAQRQSVIFSMTKATC